MSKKNKNDEKDYTGLIICIAIIVCLLLWIGGAEVEIARCAELAKYFRDKLVKNNLPLF